jgi:hypothetical protein
MTHPDRKRSNYPDRLRKRGLTKAPTMEDLETLRKRQQRRYDQAGSPWPDLWNPNKPKMQEQLDLSYGGHWYAGTL